MGKAKRGPSNMKLVSKQIRELFSGEEADKLINELLMTSKTESINNRFSSESDGKNFASQEVQIYKYIQKGQKSSDINNVKNNKIFRNKKIKVSSDYPLRVTSQIPDNYEKWPGKLNSPEDLIVFFRRVWGPFIGHGLTLAHIRKMDKKLYNAIFNWKAREKRDWPSDLRLPTQSKILSDNLDSFQTEECELSPKALLSVIRKIERDRGKT